jgi:DNA-binding response OmpR family regulator
MTTKTLLLIHKDPNIGEVVQACLTDLAGWNVGVASSTLEGLRQASLYQPDAIILEVSVGEIDGLLFLKELKAQPATQEIPVVLLTLKAKWSELQHSWFQKYQVAAAIVNPLDPAMLVLEIAKVLGWDLDV